MPLRPLSPLLRPLALTSLALLPACGQTTAQAPGQWASMANPAAQYCAEQGGRLELRREEAGQAGYCHLPDGSVVEEWQLFRGRNAL